LIADQNELVLDTIDVVALAAIVSVQGRDAGIVLGRRSGVVVTSEDDSIGKVLVRKLRINTSIFITKAGLV
jgi:hypothetical protein